MRSALLALCLVSCSRGADATASTATTTTPSASVASGSASAPTKAADPILARMLKWKGGGTDIGAIKPETEDEVIDAYAKNPVRADAQRRGKPIELAGQIATIGKDPDGAYVEMVGRKKGLADHRIRAFVDAGDALSMDRLAKAEKGQRCMFACDKCDGWDDVMLVQLRDCAIECK